MATNEDRPYGFIYKTIFSDGRYYIGQHKIINHVTLDPKYFGSGRYMRDYIKSRGTSGLTRDILVFGYSHDEMNELEISFLTGDVLNDPLCVNIDTGGRHRDSRDIDVRRRIGQSISRARLKNPDRWSKTTGDRNNKSNNWKMISPTGQVFTFCGGMKTFCKSVGISGNTMSKAVQEGWIPRRGSCAGWQAFNLDTGQGTTRGTLNHGESHSGLNNPWYKNTKT